MIRTTITLIVALAGFTTLASTADAHHTRDWRGCKYEDGSGMKRCVWDARHMGNGVGTSWKIIRGGQDDARHVRISHRRAHHLLNR